MRGFTVRGSAAERPDALKTLAVAAQRGQPPAPRRRARLAVVVPLRLHLHLSLFDAPPRPQQPPRARRQPLQPPLLAELFHLPPPVPLLPPPRLGVPLGGALAALLQVRRAPAALRLPRGLRLPEELRRGDLSARKSFRGEEWVCERPCNATHFAAIAVPTVAAHSAPSLVK